MNSPKHDPHKHRKSPVAFIFSPHLIEINFYNDCQQSLCNCRHHEHAPENPPAVKRGKSEKKES